ncbi:hypothetical protein FHG87_008827 [Trinorchestia longiramus]|nr:hypothetical protein FHG87_008827 [Trinorchestia longiramus]
MFKLTVAVLLVGFSFVTKADDSHEFWGDDSDERFGGTSRSFVSPHVNTNWAVQRPSTSSWRRRDFSDESDERWGSRAWARPLSTNRWNTHSRNTWNSPSRNTWKSPTRNTWNSGHRNLNSIWSNSARQNNWSKQNKWGTARAWNSNQTPSQGKWQANNSWNRRWW